MLQSASRFRTTEPPEDAADPDGSATGGVYEVPELEGPDPLALTPEEEEALMADTKGETPPEDPQALAVWKARQELRKFDANTRAKRKPLKDRFDEVEGELREQRLSVRFGRFARFGATLIRAGFDDDTATALKRVPPADLVTLIHTLAERGMTVQDVLRQMQPPGRA